ncbi:MAG: galactosyltransferase-related protein [Gemmatimonadota bacterium]
MITICFTYFRSLTLANLAASLYSVRRQDLSQVREIVLVDNNTDDQIEAVQDVVDRLEFPVPVLVQSVKHGDPTRTHSWSTNLAIRQATASWIFMTRADYLLDFDVVKRFTEAVAQGDSFVTSNGCHLGEGIAECERSDWRQHGPRFSGITFDYTSIDSGVWMAKKEVIDAVGGLNEGLTLWGHAQTEFQHRLHASGVRFVRIPEVLFWHPAHGGEKDLELANMQLALAGIDLRECWARYHGTSPYA